MVQPLIIAGVFIDTLGGGFCWFSARVLRVRVMWINFASYNRNLITITDMKLSDILALGAATLLSAPGMSAQSTDPASVVEKWSDVTASTRIIDINFTDTSWPASFQGETGRDCPDYSAGGYVNAIIDVPAATPSGENRLSHSHPPHHQDNALKIITVR